MSTIVDITWGPHRRVCHYGAPARPRPLESYTFLVSLGYDLQEGRRVFIPGTLAVQRTLSKGATYCKNVLQTLQDPNCHLTCDQGSEWARTPRVFASVRTVNHSIEWVTPQGVSTNLGECMNGQLKTLGTYLNLFKGNVNSASLTLLK